MLSWLRKRRAESRRRLEIRELSWNGYDEAAPGEETRFQAEVIAALKRDPGVRELEFVRGTAESYFRGYLNTGSEFYIYSGEAELDTINFERWDYDSREDLMAAFLSEAVKAKSNITMEADT